MATGQCYSGGKRLFVTQLFYTILFGSSFIRPTTSIARNGHLELNPGEQNRLN